MIDHGVSCASTAAATNIVRAIHSHPRQALPGGVLESGAGSGAEATKLRIPVHAGHQFRSMPGHDSGRCRATIPVDAGRGV